MRYGQQKAACTLLVAGVLICCAPAWAHDMTVQFGWGTGREIAYRTAVTMDTFIEGEVFALLKDTSPGQHVRVGMSLYTDDHLRLVTGVSLWHKNNTGRLDHVSPWIKGSAQVGSLRLRTEWTQLNNWHYGLDLIMPAQDLLGIRTLARTALSIEVGQQFSGFMSGLIVNW